MGDNRQRGEEAVKAVGDESLELEPLAEKQTDAETQRGLGMIVLPVLVVAVILTLFLGLGVRVAAGRAKVTVPDVSGRTVSVASEAIKSSRLTTAPMSAHATSAFQSGVVIEQSPPGQSTTIVGTPVYLLVAVAPTPTVVPDVSLDTEAGAESTLGHALLKPVIYQQLSDTVPYGRVVSQMPRAGEAVMTGQQVAVFLSMGQGTGGAVVPSVLGKPVSEAATAIADVYLVALLFDAPPGTAPAGNVTDQVPAPGTRVPIGSAVPLITSTMTN